MEMMQPTAPGGRWGGSAVRWVGILMWAFGAGWLVVVVGFGLTGGDRVWWYYFVFIGERSGGGGRELRT